MVELRPSSCDSTSGILFRKTRLIKPMIPLNAKRAANCQAWGVCPRHTADKIKLTKLAKLTQPASRERNFPRMSSGTKEVIQGSQAQLEIPRDRLKAKRNIMIKASRFEASKKLSN